MSSSRMSLMRNPVKMLIAFFYCCCFQKTHTHLPSSSFDLAVVFLCGH